MVIQEPGCNSPLQYQDSGLIFLAFEAAENALSYCSDVIRRREVLWDSVDFHQSGRSAHEA